MKKERRGRPGSAPEGNALRTRELLVAGGERVGATHCVSCFPPKTERPQFQMVFRDPEFSWVHLTGGWEPPRLVYPTECLTQSGRLINICRAEGGPHGCRRPVASEGCEGLRSPAPPGRHVSPRQFFSIMALQRISSVRKSLTAYLDYFLRIFSSKRDYWVEE